MPSTSRNARWMVVSRANYYDSIGKIAASPNQEHMNCNAYAAFCMGEQGLIIGKVFRMYCSPTTKSAYPVLEWKKDDSKSNVVTCCVDIATVDIELDTWVLQLKKRFIFCPMKTLLAELRTIECEHGLETKTNDVAKIKNMLPQLREAEKKRKEEVKEKEARERKRKEGPAEEMTIVLLKEVLKEMGINFRNSSTKAQLVEKVKQARASQAEASSNELNSDQYSLDTSKLSSARPTPNWNLNDQSFYNRRQSCLYLLYHDPKEKRRVLFILLMCVIYALLQMFSEFLNDQFLSLIHQFFWSQYFLYYFVVEFIIYIVLLIYRTILKLLIDMIFAAARVSLNCVLETIQNIETY